MGSVDEAAGSAFRALSLRLYCRMRKRSKRSIIASPAIPPIMLPTTVGVEGPPPPPPPPEELDDEVAELGELSVGEGIVLLPALADGEELDSLVLEELLCVDEDEVIVERVVVVFELKDDVKLVEGCTVTIVPLTKESSKVEVLVEVVVVSEDSVMVVVVWFPPTTLMVVCRIVAIE